MTPDREKRLQGLVEEFRSTKETCSCEWCDGAMWAYGECANKLATILAIPETAVVSELRERLVTEVNKEYRQLDGWARQSDVEKAIDRAFSTPSQRREASRRRMRTADSPGATTTDDLP